MTQKEFQNKWNLNPSCGCYIPDGWLNLVDNLLKDLLNVGFRISQIVQVKSKFAGLRLYADNCTVAQDRLINEAQHTSFKICEKCGSPGYPREGSWIATLCEVHSHGRKAWSVPK